MLDSDDVVDDLLDVLDKLDVEDDDTLLVDDELSELDELSSSQQRIFKSPAGKLVCDVIVLKFNTPVWLCTPPHVFVSTAWSERSSGSETVISSKSAFGASLISNVGGTVATS